MNVVLNSRVLIGDRHDVADHFARHWKAGVVHKVDWLLSPSDMCVLAVSPDEVGALPSPSLTREVPRSDMAWVNRLEDDLRKHLAETFQDSLC